MRKFYFGIAMLLSVGMASVRADTSAPRFEDFPAKVYHGKSAKVKIVSRQDREFKTRLKELSGHAPNFAGHYTLASWGCGASCIMTVAIDVETGHTAWLPFTVCCWDVNVDEPLKFKPDSKLVTIQGSRNENGRGTYYYILEKNNFALVKAIENLHK